jgi:hypothetical protein
MLRLGILATGLLCVLPAGCDTSAPNPTGAAATVTPSAPPAPPPPPGTAMTPAAAATPSAPKAPITELQAYWGQNYIVMVFARQRGDKVSEQARTDWQGHATDKDQKPVVFVEMYGDVSSGLSGQIPGGPAISGQSAQDLWDAIGPSNSVAAAVIIGKDGGYLHDKRRGGTLGLAEALAPL